MVYLLAVLIVIPIVLGIVMPSPFDHKADISEVMDNGRQSDLGVLFFMLMVIWLLMLLRMLYLVRKGKFSIRTKF